MTLTKLIGPWKGPEHQQNVNILAKTVTFIQRSVLYSNTGNHSYVWKKIVTFKIVRCRNYSLISHLLRAEPVDCSQDKSIWLSNPWGNPLRPWTIHRQADFRTWSQSTHRDCRDMFQYNHHFFRYIGVRYKDQKVGKLSYHLVFTKDKCNMVRNR